MRKLGLALFVILSCLQLLAQEVKTRTARSGHVATANGEPLPATIKNRSTKVSVSADIKGDFSIAASDGDVLEISSVGYVTQQVSVSGTTHISIVLKAGDGKMDEVVVVGYGSQKKVNLSGAVNTVKVSNLTNRPINSLTKSLQGQVPGVTVIARPGDVGNDMGSINIRGRGNLGTSEPFYVIDGVPVSSGDFARINPADIESMSILKDAAASAIYGSRAAFGVVLVTTKKGKEGKMQVDLNAYYGSQKAVVLPDVLGSPDYATLMNEAYTNAGRSPVYTDEQIQKFRDGSDPDLYPNTDWYAATLKKSAPIWQTDLSVMGGGKTRYYMGASVMKQGSLIPGKDLTRYSLRANTESQISEIFKIGTNLSYIRDGFNNEGGSFSLTSLARMVPATVNKQSDGSWGTMTGGTVNAGNGGNNPLRSIAEGGRQSYETDRFIGSLNANLRPVKGLSLDGMFSYNAYGSRTSTFVSEMQPLINWLTKEPIESTRRFPNRLDEAWVKQSTLLAQFFATYDYQLKDHGFRLMGGASYENYNYRTLGAFRRDFINNELNAINAGSPGIAASDLGNNGDIQQNAFQSYFGRFNYNFAEKYFLEANIRFDASSKFAPGHRWGNFPSLSAAWRISKEDFFNVSWVDELKLRGSWGKLGNVNNVGNYDFYDGMSTGTVGILDNAFLTGIYQTRLANPNLTWEKVDMTNLGLDANLFHNKLTVQVDAFKKTTNDILLQMPIPFEWGVPGNTQPNNAGIVENKGIELSLGHNNHIGDFTYSISGNLSKIWNSITYLAGQDNQVTGDYYVYRQGQAIGSFYMYQADGLFVSDEEVANHASQSSSTKAGDIKFVDQNKDNIINGDDRVIVGNDVPYFNYGINLSAGYKGFDLNIMGQGVSGVSLYLPLEASWAFFNGAGVREYNLHRWTKENPDPNAAYPRLLMSADNTQNQVNNSFWLYDGDYFRIKVLSLGYSLPSSVIKKLKMQRIRFYLSSNNLFTIRAEKRMKDFDPEMASQRATYPQLKTFSAGLNVTF
ncbi:SusC/RagA family TonB-linked outer membrane protein [Flavihumibacter petaseus]|uniref:Putative TonB-dependent receptor n=1 Tax=Flavihumibacter petaseus NBRC 106054 TaxID=1220578 RepID=A0A0E9MYU8_9BACT|nr:TonB-dependent receptor [Flavihumibacter petaseus]GAO42784.1 putative TonB-dependent receptor [Flavihumibacter petaseus NBRC 106054]